MKKRPVAKLIIALFSCLIAAGCGSGGTGGDTEEPTTGTLSVGLTDAATDEYQAVYITINEVQVYIGGDEDDADSWETVATPMKTYNLLELANGVVEALGSSAVETGTYEQMRLILGTTPSTGQNILSVVHPYANYVVNANNNYYELKIPSEIVSGINLAHSFEISDGKTTDLILDFDASASVVEAAVSPNWLLKPTIKVIDGQGYAVVTGIVSSLESQAGISGVRVSLQYEPSDADDAKDAVTIQAASISDEENKDAGTDTGEFTLLTSPGTYRLVSCKDGYVLGCAVIDAVAGKTVIQDAELESGATGTVQGTVHVNGVGSETYATLSFRRSVPCEDDDGICTVEVKSVNSLTGFWYDIDLPVGTYSLVASSDDMASKSYGDIEVSTGGITTQHVYLEP